MARCIDICHEFWFLFACKNRESLSKTELSIVKKSLSFATNVWGKSFILYRQKKYLDQLSFIFLTLFFFYLPLLYNCWFPYFFMKDSCY